MSYDQPSALLQQRGVPE